ncbi:LLM class flavin-dependent oxidoreductase [Aeromicrobium sp. UC242_57]|uniref:LLM class flavin-dependent oxidoreductase n=1 Tax=Aeromicrobium sp. UC242_57 TaxID=3374624 RepID=UPI00378A8F20
MFADAPVADIPGVLGDLESQGWETVWIAEARDGREAFTLAHHLLAHTQRMNVATGIANMWYREPWAAAKAQQFLTDVSGDRFLLGLGVGHRGVTARSKVEYGRPAETLADYAAGVDRAHRDHAAHFASRRVLAALGPRMLKTAASTSAGAISYLAPVAHTRVARESLGEDAFLAVSLKIVLGRGDAALERARDAVVTPLQLQELLRQPRQAWPHRNRRARRSARSGARSGGCGRPRRCRCEGAGASRRRCRPRGARGRRRCCR